MKKRMLSKAQSSVEYLFVVAVSLSLIVPASYLFINHGRSTQSTVMASQINSVGDEIIREINNIYLIGSGSWETLEVTLPENVINVTLHQEEELVISYFVQGGIVDAVFFSDVTLSNSSEKCAYDPCIVSLRAGKNQVRISSRGEFVSLG